MSQLPKKLAAIPFTFQCALDAGLTKYDLDKLMLSGEIERVERGIYLPTELDSTDSEMQFCLATLRCGTPSAICLLSALDFYHLTDQIPSKVWMMVPHTKRVQTNTIQLMRLRNPLWDIGIDKGNKGYWITTPARTIVDCLLNKNRLGSDVVISAMKAGLKEQKVKLQDIIRMSHRMNIRHRIEAYVETLAS